MLELTVKIKLDRIEGYEQNPHAVVQNLIDQRLAGETVYVGTVDSDVESKFDITDVELVGIRD